LDDQFTPAPDEWTSQNTNWRESYLDLGSVVERELPDTLDLKQCARQWQRVILIQIKVSELKATFPRPQAYPAAFSGSTRPSRTRRRGSRQAAHRGRPPQYDWAAFNSKLEDELRRNPSLNQAQIERIMGDWCSAVWGETPVHSVLAERIRSTWLKFRKRSGDFGDFSNPGFASLSIHWGGSVHSTRMRGLRRAKLTVHH
jgi:hypothetical protein